MPSVYCSRRVIFSIQKLFIGVGHFKDFTEAIAPCIYRPATSPPLRIILEIQSHGNVQIQLIHFTCRTLFALMEAASLHLPFLLLMDTLRSRLIVCSDNNPAVISVPPFFGLFLSTHNCWISFNFTSLLNCDCTNLHLYQQCRKVPIPQNMNNASLWVVKF